MGSGRSRSGQGQCHHLCRLNVPGERLSSRNGAKRGEQEPNLGGSAGEELRGTPCAPRGPSHAAAMGGKGVRGLPPGAVPCYLLLSPVWARPPRSPHRLPSPGSPSSGVAGLAPAPVSARAAALLPP